MSAAAAAASLPQLRPKKGFSIVPDWFIEKAPARVGSSEAWLLLKIYKQTIAWNREWAVIAIEEFCKMLVITEERVRVILRKLEEQQVIDSAEEGRRRKYKLNLKTLEALDEREPKTVSRPVVELPKRERHEFCVTREQPHKIGDIVFRAPKAPVEVHAVSDGEGNLKEVILHASVSPAEARPSDRVQPAPRVQPIRTAPGTDTPTPVGVFAQGEEQDNPTPVGVSDLVNATIERFWGLPPNPVLTRRVLDAMGTADALPHLKQQVELKKRKLRELEPGILVWCAREAAKAHRDDLNRNQPRRLAEARQRAAIERCSEPEDSGTPWSELRAAIRRKLDPSYANYDGLESTAFHRIVGGVMEVLAPSRQHAEALESWHRELLAEHHVRLIPLEELQ